MASSQLVFHHQDGPLMFEITRAVYHLSPEALFSFSIECSGNREHNFMGEPSVCFMRCPVGGAPRAGQTLEILYEQGERDSFDSPSTHLYVGSHFDPRKARVKLLSLAHGRIEVLFTFEVDDPQYYDARAKPTSAKGRVWLSEVPLGDVRDLM